MLKSIWTPRAINTKTKIRIFSFNVKSVLLYGCDMRPTSKTKQQKIQTFFHSGLRHVNNIRWPKKICSEDQWELAGQKPGGQADTAEEVGLHWTYPQKSHIQHHTPSPDLESIGEEE